MNPCKTIVSLLLIGLLFSSESIATPKPLKGTAGDSIIVLTKSIRKSHKISLYPDANQEVLFFSVRGVDGKVYQLYLFDMDGNIIHQHEIRHKQTALINNVDKGDYLFEVFSDDERIGTGHIVIK